MTITLHQLPRAFGLPVSVSPFCTKLEAYFRLAGLDYRVVEVGPNKSPTGEVPFVTLPGGRVQADSADIIAEFEFDMPRLDKGMDDSLRATAHELTTLAEGPVYFGCLYARFVEDGGWQHQKQVLRGLIPRIAAPVVMPLVRRAQRKRCAENGIVDRGSYETVLAAIADLSDALGDKPYLFGAEPRTVDCAVWAQLLHTAYTKADNPARLAVRENPRLMAYIDRVGERAGFELSRLSAAA